MCEYNDKEIIIKTPLLDNNLERVIFNDKVYEIDAGCVKSITFTFNAGEVPRLIIERMPDINKTNALFKEKDNIENIRRFSKKEIADVFNVPEHYLSKPKSLMLLEEGIKIEKVEIPSENDIIKAKEKLEHNRASLKSWNCYNTPGRQQGKSYFQDMYMQQYIKLNKNIWTEKEVRKIEGIDDPLIRDENGGYIVPDDIGNEIIETINKQEMDKFSEEVDKSLTNIESEDEYFDNIKPMMAKRDNK